MESWEPDQIFGKADFPSRSKKEGEGKPAGGEDASAKHPSGKQSTGKADQAPPQRPQRTGRTDAQGPVKTLKSGGVFSGKGWQPEQINTNDAKVIRHRTDEERAAEQKADHRQARTQHPRGGTNPSASGSTAGTDAGANAPAFPAQLFRQAALESPETSIRFLRKWLWEKWPPPGGPTTGAGSIEPHDRIFIVLSTLGMKVVQYLFQIMSPRERAEFQKILKRPPRHNPVSVAMVCRAFMDGVKDSY